MLTTELKNMGPWRQGRIDCIKSSLCLLSIMEASTTQYDRAEYMKTVRRSSKWDTVNESNIQHLGHGKQGQQEVRSPAAKHNLWSRAASEKKKRQGSEQATSETHSSHHSNRLCHSRRSLSRTERKRNADCAIAIGRYCCCPKDP